MLKRIHVHNFRSFVGFEWTLPPISVLVGPNGSGKTALLEVLWLLQDVVVAGKSIDETSAPAARTSWLDMFKSSRSPSSEKASPSTTA